MKNLLSGLNLKKWSEKLQTWPPVIRSGVLAASGFFILLLTYVLIIEPLINLAADWSREVKQKELELAYYQEVLKNKNNVAARLQSLQTMLSATNKQMLSGTNSAVAAADLQEILKNLLKTYGTTVLAINVQPPKERGSYLEIPILVQMNSNIQQLFKILYHLEHNQKFIQVLEINIARTEETNEQNTNLRADLIVAGIIKKGVSS
jgi:Tfp pilus assembly protein PilO